MIIVECETLVFNRVYKITIRRKGADILYQQLVTENYAILPAQAIAICMAQVNRYCFQDVPEPEFSKELEGG